MNTSQITIKNTWIFLLILSSVYFAQCFIGIKHVGLSHDSAMAGIWGVSVLKNAEIQQETPYGFNLFGTFFPTAYKNYAFALPSYMLIPFFILFGINIFSFKLMSILSVWLTLIMLFYILKQFLGKKTAGLTLILTVISMNFIHFTRIGNHVTEPYINLFFTTSLFFIIKYLHDKKYIYLYTSAFALGLSMSIKLSAISRILGLLVVSAIFYKDIKKNINIKILPGLIFFFLCGSFLFIHYNFQSRGETFKLIKKLYESPDMPLEIDNTKLGKNIQIRAPQLISLLKETLQGFEEGVSEQGIYAPVDKLLVIIFLIALLTTILFSLYHKDKNIKKIYFFYFIMLLSVFFSPDSMRKFHLYMLYPFPQIVYAVFIRDIWRLNKQNNFRIYSRTISILIIFILLYINIHTSIRYHLYYFKTGGTGIWSGYTEELIDYLNNSPIHPIYTVDWGLNHTIKVLSQGKINQNDLFHETTPETFKNDIVRTVDRYKTAYFVILARTFQKNDIEQITDENTLCIKKFKNKLGNVMFYIFKVNS